MGWQKPLPRFKVAIIGAGASGLLVLLQLLSKYPENSIEIDIFDPASLLGGGLAYSSNDETLLLNVAAGNMGYDPSRPSDFEEWVQENHPQANQQKNYPFVPRVWFRKYLNTRLAQYSPLRWTHHKLKIHTARWTGLHWKLRSLDGFKGTYNYIFLASGYEGQLDYGPLQLQHSSPGPRILSCFDDFQEKTSDMASVAILGSGLSSFDVWRSLRAHGNQGPITLISRRGLVPLPHPEKRPLAPLPIPKLAGLSPLVILRILRALQQAGAFCWADIADWLRPQISAIWSVWSHRERDQFLRHLKTYWDVIRHRLPPSVWKDWQEEMLLGKVRVVRARVRKCTQSAEQVELHLSNSETIQTAVVIVATGAGISQNKIKFTLPFNGIKNCQHGLGYINTGAPHLAVIGPASKSLYWEITAIPDIRKQVFAAIVDLDRCLTSKDAFHWAQFQKHPESAHETYLQHFKASLRIAVISAHLAYRSLIHSIFPMFFHDSVSNRFRDVNKKLSKRREKAPAAKENKAA